MIFGLFGRRFSDATHALYRSIVTEARQPEFYRGYGVPDTVGARFDMLVLHLTLVLRRMRGEAAVAGRPDPAAAAQDLVDLFFREMDRAMREMGVGDLSIPKKMKKLAAAWNGRSLAYDHALEEGDAAALAAALGRNVLTDVADGDAAASALAAHVLAVADALAATPLADVLEGRIRWPDPAEFTPRMLT